MTGKLKFLRKEFHRNHKIKTPKCIISPTIFSTVVFSLIRGKYSLFYKVFSPKSGINFRIRQILTCLDSD